MKFSEYLDILYVNGNISLQTKGFDLKTQAETRAIPVLMDRQRAYYRTLAYFKFVAGFFIARLTGKWPERLPIPTQNPIAEVNPGLN